MTLSQTVRIIFTSDTHGHWLTRPDDGTLSMSQVASTIKHLQHKPADVTLTIDLGDFIQGSSFATYLNKVQGDGSVIARGMNDIKYDYQIIGNHEFNFGPNYLRHILNQLNAELLVSNIIEEDTGEPFVGQPYQVIEQNGVKIGIIGATTKAIPNWELPQHYEGLVFLDAVETVRHYVEEIRSHVDLLIVAYHGGFERDLQTGEPTEILTGENQGYQMVHEIEGIDILLTGHQHRTINQDLNGTWVMQPSSYGEYVGEVTCTIQQDDGITSLQGVLHPTADYSRDDTFDTVIQPEASEGEAWLNQVLGYAPLEMPYTDENIARLYGHPYVEFINQIQLDITDADFSATTLINRYFTLFTGEITNEILLQSYPFYNLIAKVHVTGQELKEIMEFNLVYWQLDEHQQIVVNPKYYDPKPRHYNWDIYSGLKAIVDLSRPKYQRIIALINERTGEAIDPEHTYTLAISQYRAMGGGEFHWFGKEKVEFMTEQDIASLIPQALREFTPQRWEQINQDYRHIVWQPAFEISDTPIHN